MGRAGGKPFVEADGLLAALRLDDEKIVAQFGRSSFPVDEGGVGSLGGLPGEVYGSGLARGREKDGCDLIDGAVWRQNAGGEAGVGAQKTAHEIEVMPAMVD